MRGQQITPSQLAVVSLGGALGACARWALSTRFPVGDDFPWVTLCINVGGSLLLALLPALLVVRRHQLLPLFLGTGVLGGFTTLSTFSEETRALLASGSFLAVPYVLVTVLAAAFAVELAHHWSTPAAQQLFDDEEGDE
ncbi:MULTISPECIES: fluoride efflux transporter FluC [unclassified Nocardioides]|uniref:fluoride efflux transporter FluC n=1 Tax=unclassified Nocardioides TaxID=2615069 RepID=UPI0006F61CA8|nr:MULTISPECIES: CrcB family protein [unclassified Nocardioides]KQY56969.1 hypothetical protein ASD30_11900 [Nocardioides sp. Root140]KQZ66831.1 hypothetical protein ASD66_17540 [Nocardioides sp. Root151]KRF13092.1 hypothetical protein ASH02_16545 [Nocardioides sp. Soil796]